MTGPDPPKPVPPRGDENKLYEVFDGQVVVKEEIGPYGSVLASRLGFRLGDSAEGHLGRVITHALFRISRFPDIQRRPEVALVSFERWPRGLRLPSTESWDVVPDLVVEIVSPTNLAEEILTKVREYFEAGVRRAWVIYLHESLVYEYDSPRSIRVLGRDDVLDGGEVIPGFRLPLSELLEGTDEPEPA